MIEKALKKENTDSNKMQRDVGREVKVMERSFTRIRRRWNKKMLSTVRKKINIQMNYRSWWKRELEPEGIKIKNTGGNQKN